MSSSESRIIRKMLEKEKKRADARMWVERSKDPDWGVQVDSAFKQLQIAHEEQMDEKALKLLELRLDNLLRQKGLLPQING